MIMLYSNQNDFLTFLNLQSQFLTASYKIKWW